MKAVHLEDEGSAEEAGIRSEDPDGIEGVTEEFIVRLARVVKETQKDEKRCYHCSSTDHFICECLLVKASRSAIHLDQKEGMALEMGAQTPFSHGDQTESDPGRHAQGIANCTQTPFLNSNPFLWWYGVKNVAKVRINGESCMVLLEMVHR